MTNSKPTDLVGVLWQPMHLVASTGQMLSQLAVGAEGSAGTIGAPHASQLRTFSF